jgi:hypothetical protein
MQTEDPITIIHQNECKIIATSKLEAKYNFETTEREKNFDKSN